MNILVTGSTGFIGSALTKRLVVEGHNVTALTHNKQPKFFHNNIKYIKTDIADCNQLKKINWNFDVVFHCAALVKDYGLRSKFLKINLEGTKNIVKLCTNIKYFIYLGHIRYESNKNYGNYTKSKYLAEQYLVKKFKEDDFPVVIIRPGNVYGPGATTWVLRPLRAIKKNQIYLIDNGDGIFQHTYIDNLLDAMINVLNKSQAIGEIFDITDGDSSIKWKKYFNDIAEISNHKPITKNISKSNAHILSIILIIIYHLTGIKPLITPTAIRILSNKKKISIKKAENILDYRPKVGYNEAMKKVKKWLEDENLI